MADDSLHKNHRKRLKERFRKDGLDSFTEFQDLFEKIKNRSDIDTTSKNEVTLPKFRADEIRQASVGAGVILGGLGGAALGTAGGFAAAGATTTVVMALGTASTGTAIPSLSGAAATNAALATLGGGSLAAGGGGMALGASVLGGATLGVGLLVGGFIFNATGSKLSNKAEEAHSQMLRSEKKIDAICEKLDKLRDSATSYISALKDVNRTYVEYLGKMKYFINTLGQCDWGTYSYEQKNIVKNTVIEIYYRYFEKS